VRSPGKTVMMARGRKSQANLKRTAGPGVPKMSAQEKADKREAQKIARKLLDPNYLKVLKARLLSGKIQPGVEVAIWQYAFGRPVETIETKDITPVRISHEYMK
jgi:hypothetical protein